MEVWRQLKQAGLLPPGLGPPPWALRGVPPARRPNQTPVSPEADPRGAKESLLWIWEELGTLRRLDVQLLGQLCSLGLELGALREELAAVLEEEEESSEEEEEEGGEAQGNQGEVTCRPPAQPRPHGSPTLR